MLYLIFRLPIGFLPVVFMDFFVRKSIAVWVLFCCNFENERMCCPVWWAAIFHFVMFSEYFVCIWTRKVLRKLMHISCSIRLCPFSSSKQKRSTNRWHSLLRTNTASNMRISITLQLSLCPTHQFCSTAQLFVVQILLIILRNSCVKFV